ncbi:MAG: Grx4 family monothiol glutaredoxin [Candidatus Thermoplasmatota archaeon]|nr:Grx4 family monothiol glutaredoxin [Candidatus Thermoplasmatota archaeon]
MSEFNWTPTELDEIINNNQLVLFMKGTPEMPQCGFSNRASQVLQALGQPFVSVNVLMDSRAIPSICEWSDFPTMPQVFVNGELIGGSDLALEMYESGELQEMLAASEESSED